MVLAPLDLNYILLLLPPPDSSRGCCIFFVANPELTMVVESPGVKLPFFVLVK